MSQKRLSFFSKPPNFLTILKNVLILTLFLSITVAGWKLLATIVELMIASYVFFKKPIAFDTVLTQWYFMLIFIGALYIAFFGLKKVLCIIKESFDDFGGLSRFNNSYFIVTVIISFVVLSAGLSIIQNMYSSDLPTTYMVSIYDNYDNATLFCENKNGYDAWVVGDIVICQLNITDEKTHYYDNVTVDIYYYALELTDTRTSNISCFENKKFNNTFCPNIKIPIKYASNADVTIQFDERQKNPIEGLSFESITSEEYKKQRYEVFSLMFLLVSVGVFSVVSAMRNIQQMLEDPLKKEKK